jgi:hypothetical protein
MSWQTVTASAAPDLAMASVSACSSLGGTPAATDRASAIQGSSAAIAQVAFSSAEAAKLMWMNDIESFMERVPNQG